jgi:RNA polymerase sigma-70 factor (ECF subfamily)
MSSDGDTGANQVDTMGVEYLDGLYGYALALTRDPTNAEDLVQETYVRAIPAMSELRARSNLKGRLSKILRSVWFNELKKQRNGPQLIGIEEADLTDSLVSSSKSSYHLFVSMMEAERVRAAIQCLPLKFCEIILLRDFEELSYHQIAKVLNCPVGTVMSRLSRARAKLSTVLTSMMKKSPRRGITQNEAAGIMERKLHGKRHASQPN